MFPIHTLVSFTNLRHLFMKKQWTALAFLLSSCLAVVQAQQTFLLYPGTAPGSEGRTDLERTDSVPGKNIVFVGNVSAPTLTAYKPESQSGAAMVICPGGAFRTIALQHEGEDVAKWLNTKGITAFVLKYRTVPNKGGFDQELMDDLQANRFDRIDEINRPFVPLAVDDGKEAIRYLRQHAAAFGIDPDRIGMMGFSAGGTLTASVAQTADADSRPDFIAPIYAYIPAVMGAKVPTDAPPMFLALAADDPIAAGNPGFYQKWRDAGRSAELHVFAKGGHGFGMNQQNLPSDDWKVQLAEWLEIQGCFMTKSRLANNDPAGSRWWRETNEGRNNTDWPWLKRFDKENRQLAAPARGEKRVVFMGNSITEGWGNTDPDFFKGKPYVNRGISGQTTPQMLLRFRQDVIDLKPAVVVLLAGTNDIAGNTGPTTLEATAGNIFSMAELAQANGIKVVLCALVPAFDYPWKPGLEPAGKIVQLNAMLKDYANRNGCVFVDYHTAMKDDRNGLRPDLGDDGVHPNLTGYRIMGPLVEKGIAAALK